MRRRAVLFVLALAATAVGGSGCTEEVQSSTAESAEDTARAATAGPARTEASRRPYSGHLYSERDVEVYSRLEPIGSNGGVPVVSIEAEVGDRVASGEVLAVLEDRDADLAVEAARPPYRAAVAEFERLKELHRQNAAPEAELERARYEMQSRKAALDRAELTLSRTRVRAPFRGVVSERHVKTGQRVTGEMPLFRVTALRPLRVRLLLPEGTLEGMEHGARVVVEGVDGDTATGRVVIVGPTIDPASGTREVVVELVDPEGFEPGGSVRVRRPAGEAAGGEAQR